MRRGDFRDPMIVLEEKQNRTCMGCAQIERNRFAGVTKFVCLLGVQKAALDVYEMPRCKKYVDRMNMTPDQSQQIEEILMTWYRWQVHQSDAEKRSHWYRAEDRTCREYTTPTGPEDDDESAYQWADDQQSEQVQLCVDLLAPEQRAAISVSVRNKVCGRAVWSSGRAGDQHATYQAAKERLLPLLIARHLIMVASVA